MNTIYHCQYEVSCLTVLIEQMYASSVYICAMKNPDLCVKEDVV